MKANFGKISFNSQPDAYSTPLLYAFG